MDSFLWIIPSPNLAPACWPRLRTQHAGFAGDDLTVTVHKASKRHTTKELNVALLVAGDGLRVNATGVYVGYTWRVQPHNGPGEYPLRSCMSENAAFVQSSLASAAQ